MLLTAISMPRDYCHSLNIGMAGSIYVRLGGVGQSPIRWLGILASPTVVALEMAKKREVPTAEKVATAANGDEGTARRALRAIVFNDDTDE